MARHVWLCEGTRRLRSAPTTTVRDARQSCGSVVLIGAVVPDMELRVNIGSDRSWVWNAAADVSEGEPEALTLAIRFKDKAGMCSSILPSFAARTNHILFPAADAFQQAFTEAQQANEKLFTASAAATA